MKVFVISTKELILFAVPIILGQLGQMLIGAGDILIAGHHGTDTLAAIGLANGVLSPLFISGLALAFGMSPILSNKRGTGEDVSVYLWSSLVYVTVLSVMFALLTWAIIPAIALFNFEAKLIPMIQDYMFLIGFSYLGSFIFHAIKEYLQSYELVIVPNTISIIAVFFNIALNYCLVFGIGPLPSFGFIGLAYASITTRTIMALTLIPFVWKELRGKKIIDMSYLSELIKLSVPISISVFLEVSAFFVGTLVVGLISTLQVAAHNIVLTLTGVTFMVPLAISSALSVKVGFAYGTKNIHRIIELIKSGHFLSISFMSFTALTYLLIPQLYAKLFTADESVIEVVVPLLYIVALFQLSDGFQVTISGILRGMKISKSVSVVALICYWIIGVPLGVYLAIPGKYDAKGIWIGLAVALTLAAVILGGILYRKIKLELVDL
ncbi:MAG: MATE family efflux transporter [Bacteriovoracaceae bacterium]|nr:MATE family efflux transporter [Bacteriovoracaceae bacterium]